jgi:hypothetical protein
MDWATADPFYIKILFEGTNLPAERVSFTDDVHQAKVVAIKHDHSGTGSENRTSVLNKLSERFSKPLPLYSMGHGRRLTTRDDQTIYTV